MTTVLIVEDEPTPREFLEQILTEFEYEVVAAENLAGARKEIETGSIDVVLLDVNLPDGNGLGLLEQLNLEHPSMPVIMLTGYGDIDMAVEAMQLGAADFMAKPVDTKRLQKSLKRAAAKVALHRELDHLRSQQFANFDWVPSQAEAMRPVVELIERAAPTNANVLLIGETGAGKELVAKAVYDLSPRSGKAFMPLNCATLPDHLVESELFGHEPNAFTGAAAKRKKGIIEAADGGTLFLDEISSLKPEVQTKLLRTLEERTIRRVGGIKDIKVDIRLIAASNQNLEEMLAAGTFRADLYYRVNVIEIQLPPLRERAVDIPAFAGAFVRRISAENGKNIQSIHPRALEALQAFPWPGNIRQLRNAIEHAVLFCDNDEIQIGHLPAILHTFAPAPAQILQPAN